MAPTDIVGSDEPTLASDQLKPRLDGYGQNGWAGPSSLTPGQDVTRSLDISPKGGDQALDIVKAQGSRTIKSPPLDPQTRSIAGKNVPNHPGTRDANVGGAPRGDVPAALISDAGEPIRKP